MPDGTEMVSKSCRSNRIEAQFWQDDEKVAYCYWGMGTSFQHKDLFGLVVFAQRLDIVRALLHNGGDILKPDRCVGDASHLLSSSP
jgi:hypothetical protein